MHIPAIHPDTIEEVKQRSDIYDVISEYVVLRKRGKDFVGLCPFHNEKTPSFSVSPAKQIYYCFGCQAGGNAIKFLMEIGKQTFPEVLVDLARRYQIAVKTLEPEGRQELQRQMSLREQLYDVLAATAQFYQHALTKNDSALLYLQQNRQLSTEIIQQFGLGYAPGGWETLYRYLVEDKHYPVQLVVLAGLIKPRQSGGGYYDVFRSRLMIPIHDLIGRVIGFGGRSLGDEQPKYLNSPETELFNKGRTLFALDKAKTAISKQDGAVIVEGYFDAVALHAKGITNVVASLGTALSIEQVKLVLRYTDSKQLILNFDADTAGVNAAQRAIGEVTDLVYKGEVQLKVLNLPDGKDPDEYLQIHNSEDYQQLLANAPLWLDWQIQQIVEHRDLKSASDFQLVSQNIVNLLKNIVNKDTLNYYIAHCAEILSVGDARLVSLRAENLLTQLVPASSYPKYQSPRTKEEKTSQKKSSQNLSFLEEAEALLLRIYINYQQHRQIIINALEERDLEFSFSHHRFLWQQILEVPVETEIDLISTLQDKYLEFSPEMQQVSHLFYLNEKTKQEIIRPLQVIQAAIASIEMALCEKRCHHFLELCDAEPERFDHHYKAYEVQKHRLKELEIQRLFSITDLL